ncbi:MAG: hypothetical protein LBP53_07295 [Candidatus Peribacteria bacterium]|nr:hypothetical protein [Candidatus Peribacteria bacterium]
MSGVASFGNATAFNGFLNNQVESILEKQNEEAVHKINNLQEQMGEYTRQRQNLTNEQTRKQSLETEKYDREIEACNADYQAYQSLDTEKIKKVDTILVSLIKDVSEYSGAMIEHVK